MDDICRPNVERPFDLVASVYRPLYNYNKSYIALWKLFLYRETKTRFFTSNLDWQSDDKFCQTHVGHLVAIRSKQEQDAVVYHISRTWR